MSNRGSPLESVYLSAAGLSNVKIVADRHMYMAFRPFGCTVVLPFVVTPV